RRVAPLKRSRHHWACDYRGGFPRVKTRGPIEANLHLLDNCLRDTFPRVKTRGPIEAFWAIRFCRASLAFPRVKTRGPIEAAISRRARRWSPQVSTREDAWPH